MLKRYIISGWLHSREALELETEKDLPTRHELAMINSNAMKSKCIIIPYLLQRQILEQLHSSHMGTEKTCLLTRESVY